MTEADALIEVLPALVTGFGVLLLLALVVPALGLSVLIRFMVAAVDAA